MAETAPFLTQPEAYKPPSLEQTRCFEVVMIRDGASDLTAKPEDFKRVPVEVVDPITAVTSKEVAAVKGFRPMFAANPGIATEPEILARRREMEGPPVDRSKI